MRTYLTGQMPDYQKNCQCKGSIKYYVEQRNNIKSAENIQNYNQIIDISGIYHIGLAVELSDCRIPCPFAITLERKPLIVTCIVILRYSPIMNHNNTLRNNPYKKDRCGDTS